MAKEGFATKKFPTSVSTILYLTYKTLAENIFKNFTKNSASYIDSLDSCFRNQNSSKVLFPSLTKSYYTCDNCYELWQESITSPMVECTSFCNLFSFLRSCGIFIKTRRIRISKLQKYVERAIINNKCRVLNLKSDSHLPKSFIFILFQGKPFKNDEKCFLFRLKSSFRSQDI